MKIITISLVLYIIACVVLPSLVSAKTQAGSVPSKNTSTVELKKGPDGVYVPVDRYGRPTGNGFRKDNEKLVEVDRYGRPVNNGKRFTWKDR